MKIPAPLSWLLLLAVCLPAYQFVDELNKAGGDDPLVWEADIQALEKKSALHPEPENAVVFVGSSSIRLWSTLPEDMHPIPVIQRGFGGAKLYDVAFYARRLVNVHKPRAVVVFAGTNDIHPGNTKPPEILLRTYQDFVATVREDQKNLPVYYIAITPSILRWEVWDIAQRTNQLIKEYSDNDQNLHVIDTAAALLSGEGMPDAENYRADNLHLSEKGYQIWTRIIRDQLIRYAGPDIDAD